MKVKRRYDWRVRWTILTPDQCKMPRHEVIVFDKKVLLEMAKLGYLRGQAEVDARKKEGS